jgi:hypothetical protein
VVLEGFLAFVGCWCCCCGDTVEACVLWREGWGKERRVSWTAMVE